MGKELSLNILEIARKVQKLESAGGESADTAKMSDIATEFSEATNYTAGCFVYYEGKLYQFNADHSAGAWDPTDVAEANVTDQIVSNASAIAGLTASDVAYDNTTSGLSATKIQGALDELKGTIPKLSVRLKAQSGVAVTANTPADTTIDWTGIDKSKVLASWVWWSNSASDIPAGTPVIYYELTDNVGCVKKVKHSWTVNQTVNFNVVYIYME